MAVYSDLSGYRFYSRPFNTNQGTIAFNQLYDENAVYYNGTTLNTGGWRPFFPSDFQSSISVSGLSLTVGSVAVTGGVTINNTAPMPVSGVFVETTLETGLAYLNQLTQQNQTLLQAISGGVANTNTWKIVASSGYVQSFTPVTGSCVISKIYGYSKATGVTDFIQIFDGTGQVGFPIGSQIAQSGNNFFYDFSASQGVTINNGITVANSFDPVLIQPASADFFVSVIYKQYQ